MFTPEAVAVAVAAIIKVPRSMVAVAEAAVVETVTQDGMTELTQINRPFRIGIVMDTAAVILPMVIILEAVAVVPEEQEATMSEVQIQVQVVTVELEEILVVTLA